MSGLFIWSRPRKRSTLPESAISQPSTILRYGLNQTPVSTFEPSLMTASIIVRLREMRRLRTLVTVPPTVTSSPSGTDDKSKICDRSR